MRKSNIYIKKLLFFVIICGGCNSRVKDSQDAGIESPKLLINRPEKPLRLNPREAFEIKGTILVNPGEWRPHGITIEIGENTNFANSDSSIYLPPTLKPETKNEYDFRATMKAPRKPGKYAARVVVVGLSEGQNNAKGRNERKIVSDSIYLDVTK
jgi:hypothetical protein